MTNNLEEGMKLLSEIATKIYKKTPQNHLIEKGDLIAWGFFGLSRALNRFDPLLSSSFTNYARRHIYGAIMDGLGEGGMTEKSSPMGSIKRNFPIVSIDNWELSFEETKEEKRDFEILKEGVKTLPFLQQVIIRLYFWEDNKMSTIGEKLGRSKGGISDILLTALITLKKYILERQQ